MSAAVNLAVEPRPGVNPVAFGRGAGNVQRLGSLGKGKAGKVTQLYQAGLERLFDLELPQRFVPRKSFFSLSIVPMCEHGAGVELNSAPAGAALLTVLAPRLVNQNAAHGLGGGAKKMPSTVPMLGFGHIHQPKVGLVDQGR